MSFMNELNRPCHNTVFAISGASRGLGFALAVEADARGHQVYGCARRPEAAVEPPAFALRRVDASRADDVSTWLKDLPLQEGWRLAINHGILGPRLALKDTGTDDFGEVLTVNAFGSFALLHAALNLTIPPAVIAMVSSSVGRRGRAGWGAYAASKAVVESLVQTLSGEVTPDHTMVFAFNPGGTATAMRAEAYPDEDPRTLPTAPQVGAVLMDLMEQGSATLHGQSLDARDFLEG